MHRAIRQFKTKQKKPNLWCIHPISVKLTDSSAAWEIWNFCILTRTFTGSIHPSIGLHIISRYRRMIGVALYRLQQSLAVASCMFFLYLTAVKVNCYTDRASASTLIFMLQVSQFRWIDTSLTLVQLMLQDIRTTLFTPRYSLAIYYTVGLFDTNKYYVFIFLSRLLVSRWSYSLPLFLPI